MRVRNAPPTNFTLGAFDRDVLIGSATFVREGRLKERHKARIFGVYVSPLYRGKRVGRRLIETVLAKATEQESLEQILLAVATTQREALALYRSLGFQSFGLEPNALKINGRYVDEDHLIRRL